MGLGIDDMQINSHSLLILSVRSLRSYVVSESLFYISEFFVVLQFWGISFISYTFHIYIYFHIHFVNKFNTLNIFICENTFY